MNNTETYFMQLEPPPLDGLFETNESTPAAAHNAPLRATEREEQAAADATRLEPRKTGKVLTRECASCGVTFIATPGGIDVCQQCWMGGKDATRIEHMAKRVKPETTDAKFTAFVHDHPDVIGAVVGVCRDMKRAGLETYSVKAAWEIVRWQRFTSAHMAAALYKGDEPMLNNDMTAPLARYIMDNFPDLRNFFTTRRRRCELPGCLEVADD